jgi:hypothetical protein
LLSLSMLPTTWASQSDTVHPLQVNYAKHSRITVGRHFAHHIAVNSFLSVGCDLVKTESNKKSVAHYFRRVGNLLHYSPPLSPHTILLASQDSCFLCELVIQANEKPVQATTSERASLPMNHSKKSLLGGCSARTREP